MKTCAKAARNSKPSTPIRVLRGSYALFPLLLATLLVATTAHAQNTAGASKTLALSGSPLKGAGDLKPSSLLCTNAEGTPSKTPATSATTPGTPAKTPSTTATTPGTPAKTPSTTAATPETPAKTPGAPAAGGGTIIMDRNLIQPGTNYIRVIIKPHIETPGDGTMTVLLDKAHVVQQVVQGKEGGGVAPITGTPPHMDMDDPIKYIQEVRVIFDKGTVTAQGTGEAPRTVQIPVDATKFDGLEVDYAWGKDKKTLKFKAPPPPAGHRLRWLAAGVGGVVVLGALAFLLFRRKPA